MTKIRGYDGLGLFPSEDIALELLLDRDGWLLLRIVAEIQVNLSNNAGLHNFIK